MDQPTWIGRTLSGRYKIEGMLGQGGMSAVYKASDPNLKRIVAIKLIHPHLSSDPTFVARFESEAAAVASLRHQNIVQVYDFNNDNGVYYMVLEFIPGETLQDRMKRLVENHRKLSLEDSLNYTLNISDAVGYAHQRGMVHRDIKPANIMLDVQGQAILMDFGIVKILGGDSHTSTGAVVGTARYMSPEIIRGEVADNRSDIYSLGITLYEMLSGRPPFVADSAMTLMMMHLNDPVPDVREYRSDIRPEVVAILEKCLAKDRNARHQSAAELSADIKRALPFASGHPTSVRPKAAVVRPETSTAMPNQSPLSPAQVEMASDISSRPYVQPVSTAPTPSAPTPAKSLNRPIWWIAGASLLLVCCVALAIVWRANSAMLAGTATQTQSIEPTHTEAVISTEPVVVAATDTLAPTENPTDTPIPITPTPQGPYVVITGIHLNNNTYVVDYEVHNFPASPQLHVHMFFNTVSPAQAGMPGLGPWKLTWGQYGDPPFTQYGVANKPANATQMCSLVANANHTVQQGTGNCVDLP